MAIARARRRAELEQVSGNQLGRGGLLLRLRLPLVRRERKAERGQDGLGDGEAEARRLARPAVAADRHLPARVHAVAGQDVPGGADRQPLLGPADAALEQVPPRGDGERRVLALHLRPPRP